MNTIFENNFTKNIGVLTNSSKNNIPIPQKNSDNVVAVVANSSITNENLLVPQNKSARKYQIVPSIQAKNNELLKKYAEIFDKYIEGPSNELLLKASKEKSGMTHKSLLNVVKAADRIFRDYSNKRTNGDLIEVDGISYIVKKNNVEQDEKISSAKKYILRFNPQKDRILGQGAKGIVRRILLVSEGRFVVFKQAATTNIKQQRLSDDKIELNRDSIEREFKNLQEINSLGPYENFQKTPIGIDVHNSSGVLSGLVFDEIFDTDLFHKVILMDKEWNNNIKLNLEALSLCKQMMRAVAELHRRGFIHGDIKPENFGIYTEGNKQTIILADLDGAIEFDQMQITSCTLQYMSPIDLKVIRYAIKINSKKMFADFSRKRDLFSLGLTMFVTLAGHPAYHFNINGIIPSDPNRRQLISRGYKLEVIDFICKMIDPHPNKRPSSEESQKFWGSLSIIDAVIPIKSTIPPGLLKIQKINRAPAAGANTQ